ncbi:hypothetical protein [Paraburkholderia domus]|uniref:hypothetical protein n=1 Tax=Paraburkholderia domus TaxID=2793075 RepID=UPI001911DF37|nr:hypothetical protein [Paraburkholderia domus]MBK5065722.1 hypothetical protein [Burkholderia sp. R-70199]CAE6962202.1 hypothetical protein R70199_07404 [Paraburkholderia domus]
MNQLTSVVAQAVGLTNVGADSIYTWSATGPQYTNACGTATGTSYGMVCLIHPDGTLNGVFGQYTNATNGSCNH